MAPTADPADAPVSVHAHLTFEVTMPSLIELLIVPADSSGERSDEQLVVMLDDAPLEAEAVANFPLDGTTATVISTTPGHLTIDYTATVHRLEQAGGITTSPARDHLVGLRPGRYTPSDQLGGFAASMFGLVDPEETSQRIAEWVTAHITYDPAASRPTGTGADTLHAGAGVCRDFAHLTATLCRAVDIPSRVAAVYAPGLSPMDFHAVAEVLIGNRWFVLDATRLAPRQSLVRIATGRDAADTAFANVSGMAELLEMEVTAVLDADELPLDDHTEAISLR
jgi:transglutaminase-like putative cysteine protease